MRESNRYKLYRSYKLSLVPEGYFDDVKIKCFRDALVRFRLGVSDIATHRNRFIRNPCQGLNDCKFCPGHTENEKHVLFHCPAYDGIRPPMLRIYRHQEDQTIINLMSTKDSSRLRQFSWFLFKCFEMRKGLF